VTTNRKRLQATYRLKQYFRAAQAQRRAWQRELALLPDRVPSAAILSPPDGEDMATAWHFLRHRFAALYTVVEGWQRQDLSDLQVNIALGSLKSHGGLKLLKAFRHSVYHFSASPIDERDRDFLIFGLADGTIERVCRLEDAFEAYFQGWAARSDLTGIGYWQESSG
jgi:hypothetical protein